MEKISLQEIWKQNEMVLKNTRSLNLALLKEVKLDKVKRSLNNLLFLPISTMVFLGLVASYAIYFAVENLENWYFIFSGGVVAFFSVMLVVSSIMQLIQILTIDYNELVLKLQKDISRIKLSVVYKLKIVAWLLPFGPFVGLFVIKALFNFEMMTLVNFNLILLVGITTIILEILSLLLLRALKPKNANKKWLNWLLWGSGSQVNEALRFLGQIEDFKTEK